jgi:ribosome biogenesis GTPase
LNLESLGWEPFFASHLAKLADPTLRPARVVRATQKSCDVVDADGEHTLRVSGRMLHRDDKPVVGDWLALSGDSIAAILPRQSAIRRRARGRAAEAQVIAANVDVSLLVTGLDGDFNVRRIERYLAMSAQSGARAVIILNKIDLAHDVEGAINSVQAVACDSPVMAMSAKRGDGVEQLTPHLKVGTTLVLLGSSGAGKSTLVNQLLGSERQRVADVRQSDDRGRHTTTARELLPLPGGALLIDTPGLRELGLWLDEDSAGLDEAFDDVAAVTAKCRFADCSHSGEPGCEVAMAIADGRLSPARLGSYLKLTHELDALTLRKKEQQRANQRAQARSRRNSKIKG